MEFKISKYTNEESKERLIKKYGLYLECIWQYFDRRSSRRYEGDLKRIVNTYIALGMEQAFLKNVGKPSRELRIILAVKGAVLAWEILGNSLPEVIKVDERTGKVES